jgi:hypothetical protein
MPMLDIGMTMVGTGRQMWRQLPPLLFGEVSSAHRLLTFLT